MKYTICKLLIFVFAKFAILQIDASFELIKNSNTRIIINFAAALTENVTAIIFAENDKLWEINHNRIVGFERTSQIDCVLPNQLFTKRIFKKFARERLEKASYPSAYVIDSDPSSLPGQH